MNKLAIILSLLAFSTALALADDDNAQQPADDTKVEQDCSKLEGDAKAECEKAKAEADEPEENKGGKAMKKSNDNRMESFDDDNED